MSLDPKPITLAQISREDFTGAFEPQPFVVVGPMPEAEGAALEWYRVNNVSTRDNFTGTVYIEALGANGLGPVSGKITVIYPGTEARTSGAAIVVPLSGGALTAAVGGHASRGNNSKPAEIHVTLANNSVETHFGAIMFNWAKAGQQDTLYFKFPSSATFTQYKSIEVEF